MNRYFYLIWVPLQILTITCFVLIFSGHLKLSWALVLLSWFLIGPVGTGVGFHRLFSHRQFETWHFFEILLAILGSMTAYAPVLFWTAIHQNHHRISDTEEDMSSPSIYGFWESFLFYRLRKKALGKIHVRNDCVLRILKDPTLLWLSQNFILFIWIIYLAVGLLDFSLLASCLVVPAFFEHLRVNAISSFSHLNLPLSYRNFETKDTSQNNLLFGYLSFGFAWHNNHHFDPRAVILSHRWWELDIEGIIAKLISKKPR